MGIQHALLIILGAIIVAIMIAVGVSKFHTHAIQANKGGMTASLQIIAADAYQFKVRSAMLGGGDGAYSISKGAQVSYTIPSKMLRDDYGAYSLTSVTATSCFIRGTSVMDSSWVATCAVDDSGRTSVIYMGW